MIKTAELAKVYQGSGRVGFETFLFLAIAAAPGALAIGVGVVGQFSLFAL